MDLDQETRSRLIGEIGKLADTHNVRIPEDEKTRNYQLVMLFHSRYEDLVVENKDGDVQVDEPTAVQLLKDRFGVRTALKAPAATAAGTPKKTAHMSMPKAATPQKKPVVKGKKGAAKASMETQTRPKRAAATRKQVSYTAEESSEEETSGYGEPESDEEDEYVANADESDESDDLSSSMGEEEEEEEDLAGSSTDKEDMDSEGEGAKAKKKPFKKKASIVKKQDVTPPKAGEKIDVRYLASIKPKADGIDNSGLEKVFLELRQLAQERGSKQAVITWNRIAFVIRNLPYEVNVQTFKELAKMKGVGKSSMEIITEYVLKGTCSRIDKEREALHNA